MRSSPLTQARFHQNLYGPLHPAALVLENGAIFPGWGLGATGETMGELCFNTAMSGYQETLSDPSYDHQILVFTYPHIGNVGCNDGDQETRNPSIRGCVMSELPGVPSNWRSQESLASWLQRHNVIGIAGIDTRDLTLYLRDNGAIKAGLAHGPGTCADATNWNPETILPRLLEWPCLDNQDLATSVGRQTIEKWPVKSTKQHPKHIVVIDFGVKDSMIDMLSDLGARATVVPAKTSLSTIRDLEPDGVLLSNGPGDPAATHGVVGETLLGLLDQQMPCFGICLGFQLLCLSLGAKSFKLPFGHHGSNHPVKDLSAGTIKITAQNHGFAIDPGLLPNDITVTHRSLFDGTCEGIRSGERKILAVQYHPEASPGPRECQAHFIEFLAWLQD